MQEPFYFCSFLRTGKKASAMSSKLICSVKFALIIKRFLGISEFTGAHLTYLSLFDKMIIIPKPNFRSSPYFKIFKKIGEKKHVYDWSSVRNVWFAGLHPAVL